MGTLAWETVLGNPFLETCPWKPIPATLVGNLSCEHVLGNLLLGTFGNLWKPIPGSGTPFLAWEHLGTLLENLAGNLAWEPLPWNPFLGTSFWEPCLALWQSGFWLHAKLALLGKKQITSAVAV